MNQRPELESRKRTITSPCHSRGPLVTRPQTTHARRSPSPLQQSVPTDQDLTESAGNRMGRTHRRPSGAPRRLTLQLLSRAPTRLPAGDTLMHTGQLPRSRSLSSTILHRLLAHFGGIGSLLLDHGNRENTPESESHEFFGFPRHIRIMFTL